MKSTDKEQGWISLHRKIASNWVWDEKPFDRGRAWIDLLLHINHTDKKFMFDGNMIQLEAGQKITSIRKMADRWGWSRTKVTKFLSNLEKDGMLHVNSDTKKTLLTVVNWATYQNVVTPKGHRKATEKPQKDTNNNVNNDNNENNNSPEGKLLSWLMSEAPRVMKLSKPITLDQAKRILSDFDRRTIADIFTAMENHKPLTRSYMDANATFRKWASRDADRKADKNPPHKGGTFVKPKTI